MNRCWWRDVRFLYRRNSFLLCCFLPELAVDKRHREIPIGNQADIAVARMTAKELAEKLPFDAVGIYCIVTSISELASNIYFHAGQGMITVRVANRDDGTEGIEVIASDRGNGIEDVGLALQDGFSTGGSLGGGLPGVQRLMSEMDISSAAGQGTVVRAVRWVDEHKRVFIPGPSPYRSEIV